MQIRALVRLSALLLVLLAAPAAAHESATPATPAASGETMTVLSPEQITWQDAPPILPRGGRMAVLKGDPSKEGVFVIRFRAPDGYRIPPHWHPAYETVTVLKGTFHLGSGETFDDRKGMGIGVGGFAAMPPGMRHYAWCEGETEIQIAAMGPWQLYYVNPKDDPRNVAAAK
jgi:quercetin dioxygenase-like cupin family protein